ncbi:MAG TPA: adenylate kinase [Bacteriovoracaceae bacterium]|nr:adenylate kinase [Bacteriovoracaceae bacterium]
MASKHLIFIGAPGSGKGTQATKFVKESSFQHISTGDLLRNEIAKGSELGLEVKKVIDAGQLVSDELVIRLLQANIDLASSNYIFDGYPRNLAQAQTLDNEVLKGANSLAVYFEINTGRLVERLTNRRTCKDCGSIYNLVSKKPKVMGICDQCGGTNLVQRDDDKEEVIKNRLTVFEETVSPVLSYYQELGRLMRVNAEKSVDEIFTQISSKL